MRAARTRSRGWAARACLNAWRGRWPTPSGTPANRPIIPGPRARCTVRSHLGSARHARSPSSSARNAPAPQLDDGQDPANWRAKRYQGIDTSVVTTFTRTTQRRNHEEHAHGTDWRGPHDGHRDGCVRPGGRWWRRRRWSTRRRDDVDADERHHTHRRRADPGQGDRRKVCAADAGAPAENARRPAEWHANGFGVHAADARYEQEGA